MHFTGKFLIKLDIDVQAADEKTAEQKMKDDKFMSKLKEVISEVYWGKFNIDPDVQIFVERIDGIIEQD